MRSYVTLDGLRGVAALSIVLLHCYRFFGDLTWSSAALAVDLFFVLSGFVLAYAYEDKLPTGASTFLKLRFIRLYPLYIVGTLLGIFEAVLTIHYGQSAIQWTWGKLLYSLPFALLMLPAPGQMFPFNGVMWSIFFELFVNGLWAAFWRPLRSTPVLMTVVLFSAVGLALSVAYTGSMVGLGETWGRFVGGVFRVCYSFFLGVLFFRFHRCWKLPKVSPAVLIVGLPAVLFLPMPPLAQLAVALLVLPWFVLLGSQVEPAGFSRLVARKLGIASYAIYAVHKRVYLLSYAFVLQIIGIDLQLFRPFTGILYICALVPGCLLLNRWIDEPARRALTARLSRSIKFAAVREGATQAP